MRVAVVGATGQIGTYTVAALERGGHEVVRISRSSGVNVYSATGLDTSLAEVEAVIDASNNRSQNEAENIDFFGTMSRYLLAAEKQAGVRHHVLLSVVGLDNDQRGAHYAGKREQERFVSAGPIPWTIVRSTQFHELAGRVATLAERGGVAPIAPLPVQPIAPCDVGAMLADVAIGGPLNATLDIAGPQTQDFVTWRGAHSPCASRTSS